MLEGEAASQRELDSWEERPNTKWNILKKDKDLSFPSAGKEEFLALLQAKDGVPGEHLCLGKQLAE